jgi:hypothetical protein
MSRIITKRRARIALTVAGVLAVAVAALAYWTTSGGGSGTASVGTDAGVTINPVTFDGALYPGGSTTVHFTVNNTSADAPVKFHDVIADTSGGNTNGISGLPVGCSASDFHFSATTGDQEIAKGGTYSSTGTLSMDNSTSNQDACKGQSPVVHLKVDKGSL